MFYSNVPLSQEGKNLPKPTITITLSYASTGPNTFCKVTSDYAVRSTITINYTISWSGKHGFNTYQGSTTISKGSTDGGEIGMTVAAPARHGVLQILDLYLDFHRQVVTSGVIMSLHLLILYDY